MNAIKTKLKTPANRIVKIKIPDYFPINESVEVTIAKDQNNNSYLEKINILKEVKNDKLFLSDLVETNKVFESIDFESLD